MVLRGGEGLGAVFMVSSLNLALKSEEEQDALVFQYENFLNALDFTMQFVVQSRRLNIKPYLETILTRQKEETNELLKVQIGEYAEFVKSFVELTSIVAKTFFAVVPFSPSIVERRGSIALKLKTIFGGAAKKNSAASDEEFDQFKNQLLQRTDAVSGGLKRMGLRVAQLNTEELIELFYGLFNPTESQKITEEKANQ